MKKVGNMDKRYEVTYYHESITTSVGKESVDTKTPMLPVKGDSIMINDKDYIVTGVQRAIDSDYEDGGEYFRVYLEC